MLKKLYISHYGIENKEFNKALLNSLNVRRDFVYILPGLNLINDRREEFLKNSKGHKNIDITTFDRIVNEMLGDVSSKTIDEQVKKLLLEKNLAAMKEENKLDYFLPIYNYQGLIDSISDFIRQLKRNLVTVEMLKASAQSKKMVELANIYEHYEALLKNKEIFDRESTYLLVLKKLESESVKEMDVFIDSFIEFKPIEYAIIDKLLASDCKIHINIPYKSSKNNIVFLQTLEKLKEREFEIILEEDKKIDEIKLWHIIASKSSYELSKVIHIIKKKYIEDDIDFSDMHIILCDPSYSEELAHLAKEENLPLNYNGGKTLSESPIIVELINILHMISTQGKRDFIINRLKAHYFSMPNEDTLKNLDYSLRSLNFENLESLKLLLDKKTIDLEENMISATLDFVDLIEMEIDIPLDDSIVNYSEYISNLLAIYNIQEKILEDFKILKDEEILKRDMFILSKLKDLLDNIKSLESIVSQITFEEFKNLLLNYLRDSLEYYEKNLYGVKVFSPIEAIGQEASIKFITGLNIDYPKVNEENFLLSGKYAEELSALHLKFDNGDIKKNVEDLIINDISSRAKGELYYSNVKTDFESDADCSILLFNILENETIEEIYALGYLHEEYDSVTTNRELTSKIARDNYNNKSFDKEHLEYINKDGFLKSLNNRVNCEVERDFSSEYKCNEYSGNLKSKKREIKFQNLSYSFLEDYLICPFYFYGKRILKIDEFDRIYRDRDALDLGELFHKVLEGYYKKISPSEIINQVDERLLRDEITLNIQEGKDDLYFDYVFDRLNNFIQTDIERLKGPDHGFKPRYFEKRFMFNLDGVNIIGKIDRIDSLEDREIVIDYKSSSSPTNKSILNGQSLQMPIYIMSRESEGKKVVSAEYGLIKEGNYNAPLRNLDEISKFGNKRDGVKEDKFNSVIENAKLVIKDTYNSISQLDYSVIPKKCLGANCPYRNICRYSKLEGDDNGE